MREQKGTTGKVMVVRGFGTVRRAGGEDIEAAARALAAASVDEAVAAWITPDEETRARRGAEAGQDIAAWLDTTRRSAEVLLVSGDDGIAGLAMWHFVDGAGDGDGDEHADGPGDGGADAAGTDALIRVYGTDGLARMAQVREAVGRRHPSGVPHWHLSQTVIVPELRGRGLGGALLRHHLDRVDEERAAAYLEASTPRSQALYERYGFLALGAPVELPDGGPRLQPMWREGRSGLRPPGA
ncbi:GNAT family N-acetyltransferase [Streptomyces marincola]|uniref:GNAT family N-acetyltransferase n=1 Tax=Streptomyces marincola TaxID=2878388 RepID=UPI001CF5FD58|nr:GNAT family N-acetyltransferase [Streptomyces marincola]UCM91418.1 GNAT family N-acetyltransferase [Streptomyces marincola]